MPKRVATPPPGPDEPKYLTVCYPWPAHASMELAKDRKPFIYWISSIVGKEYLQAVYHKPTAPNMIIIEVKKDCPHFGKLLGAHKWSEFLVDPLPEEKDRVSKIFWCKHASGRNVQKDGWRIKHPGDKFFRDFDEFLKTKFRTPYPKSTWCSPPKEIETVLNLCCAIPQEDPIIVAPRAAPVGSAGWVQGKKTTTPAGVWGNKSSKVMSACAPVGAAKSAAIVRNKSGCSNDAPVPVAPTIKSYATASHSKPQTPQIYAVQHPHASNIVTSAPAITSSSSDSSTPTTSTFDELASNVDGLDLSPETDDDGWQISASAVVVVVDPVADGGEGIVASYSWGSDDEGVDVNKAPPCPSHGERCSKGICKDRDIVMKQWERDQAKPAPKARGAARGRW